MHDDQKIKIKAQEIYDYDIIKLTDFFSRNFNDSYFYKKMGDSEIYVIKRYLKSFIEKIISRSWLPKEGLYDCESHIVWLTPRLIRPDSGIVLDIARDKLKQKGVIV